MNGENDIIAEENFVINIPEEPESGNKSKETIRENETKEPANALQKAIAEQAREDESPLSSNFTLRKILVGDILTAESIRRQVWVILLIVAFTLLYITNRYSSQKHMIEIDRLNNELKDAKYRALSSSSQLTEKCRESNVLELLKSNNDSTLHIPAQPPYIVDVSE